jgi:glycosyltransferase involved in cell wall biosynthesis
VRVLLVITKGELGGAQTHVAQLCGALRDRCRFLVLIGGAERSPLAQALEALLIPVVPLPGLDNGASPGPLLDSARQIVRHARAWGADLIHVHSAVAAALGRIAGVLAGVPVVYTVHGFAFKPQVPLVRRGCAFAAERLLAPLSAHTICVCDAEQELAMTLGIREERVSVISNGVADTSSRARPASEPPQVIMVARIAPPKRQDLLLAALQALRDRGITPPRTVFAGSGPFLAACREAASAMALDCVSFPGDVADVHDRLAQSQLFVLLSDHEGQPISIIEAMRAGMPVLASDLPGVRAQVTDGVEGLLSPNAPEQIAQRLQRLMGEPLLRARMGAAGRRRFEAEFSATRMGEQVASVYETATRRVRPVHSQ